ncbi:TonB-dependent receptor [Simiduia sp. 21SJ11W-1]|uniref:TonB-dependent receptor plug domain-containing protein n=1 Tax=Simiduia sp. 21SJ11W-1 TaxID=2909669 RepID=UPI00209CFCD0|nr:TonB-dependent receptor [Simiduia sp. 21SJ11W-1]UTA49062.1 TonB-dependent receptor [Simiduia sp. 21SJ11W-1]
MALTRIALAYLLVCLWLPALCVNANEATEGTLAGMSLEELLKQRAALHNQSQTASQLSETVRDAPGSLVVVSAQEIARRGYQSLEALVADLPGFDTVVTNGTLQVVSYQRGYRTPWTQRTLLLVNGRVDNHLWNHAAQFSRQYPMNLIERVEVLYGPSGAVYGPNAFLGVINIITRKGEALAPDTNRLTASLQAGSYQSRALDLTWVGNHNTVNFSLGARLFSSDEAPIEHYSEWGYTDEALLANPDIWGAGIGQGQDPATGNPSPVGDINVDGSVSASERVRGKALGRYQDPSENQGLYAEIASGPWAVGASYWHTDEGYGPYYSFADTQPNGGWIHESRQLFGRYASNWSENLSGRTDLVYRDNRVGGSWVESFEDLVSISEWNNFNRAWRLEQSVNYVASQRLSFSAGLKYERKDLAKVYMVCNYFDGAGVCPAQAANSSNGQSSDGSGVLPADSISSTNPSPLPPTLSARDIPAFNRITTDDTGVFGQALYQLGQWRISAGLRWDNNSEYGAEFSPRLAAIYHYRADTTFKLIYGEAFQEPSPKDLFGGFNGRAANEDLKPEKARNLEAIAIYQGDTILHEASVFLAQYENAIAGGENVGQRRITGLEYRADARWDNPIYQHAAITAKLYYSITRAEAEYQYRQSTQDWQRDWSAQGDIAPHKINAIVNLPITAHINVNLRGQWRSARELFSENPLREQDIKAKAYSQFDASLSYSRANWSVGLNVNNLTGANYLQPGVESASSGNQFNQDNDGFQNSLLPQVNRPVYSLNIKVDL